MHVTIAEPQTLISFPSSSTDWTTLDGKVPRNRDSERLQTHRVQTSPANTKLLTLTSTSLRTEKKTFSSV